VRFVACALAPCIAKPAKSWHHSIRARSPSSTAPTTGCENTRRCGGSPRFVCLPRPKAIYAKPVRFSRIGQISSGQRTKKPAQESRTPQESDGFRILVAVIIMAAAILNTAGTEGRPLRFATAAKRFRIKIRVLQLRFQGDVLHIEYEIERAGEITLVDMRRALALDVYFWDASERPLVTQHVIALGSSRSLEYPPDYRITGELTLLSPPPGAEFVAIGLHTDLVTVKAKLPDRGQ
jgi:hypothetical protein